mmetsp:Transcript_8042/g.18654  ORF Transcript_8042/g.18654 Transcript_8042/m.18654 type:complete len:103 (-) Transcript_8042:682-990(-)
MTGASVLRSCCEAGEVRRRRDDEGVAHSHNEKTQEYTQLLQTDPEAESEPQDTSLNSSSLNKNVQSCVLISRQAYCQSCISRASPRTWAPVGVVANDMLTFV